MSSPRAHVNRPAEGDRSNGEAVTADNFQSQDSSPHGPTDATTGGLFTREDTASVQLQDQTTREGTHITWRADFDTTHHSTLGGISSAAPASSRDISTTAQGALVSLPWAPGSTRPNEASSATGKRRQTDARGTTKKRAIVTVNAIEVGRQDNADDGMDVRPDLPQNIYNTSRLTWSITHCSTITCIRDNCENCDNAAMWEECVHHCCRNQRIQRRDYPATTRRTTLDGRGSGLFSVGDIPRATMIGELTGEVISRRAATRLRRAGRASLTADLTAHQSLDASRYGSHMWYANHSCDGGNADAQVWHVGGLPHLMLVASRDIHSGEEILWDYLAAAEEQYTLDFACKCGTPACGLSRPKAQRPQVKRKAQMTEPQRDSKASRPDSSTLKRPPRRIKVTPRRGTMRPQVLDRGSGQLQGTPRTPPPAPALINPPPAPQGDTLDLTALSDGEAVETERRPIRPTATAAQHEALRVNLQREGFTIVDVPPDNHCFFHCIGRAPHLASFGRPFRELRRMVAAHLSKHPRLERTWRSDYPSRCWLRYLEQLAEGAEWADPTACEAAMELFSFSLETWCPGDTRPWTLENPAATAHLRIAWVAAERRGELNHFQLVVDTSAISPSLTEVAESSSKPVDRTTTPDLTDSMAIDTAPTEEPQYPRNPPLTLTRADHDRLFRRLADMGLTAHNTPGDGHCFFTALRRAPGSPVSHLSTREMRRQLAQYLRDRGTGFNPDEASRTNWDRYLTNLGEGSEWADNATMAAAAELFSITMEVWQPEVRRPIILDGPSGSPMIRLAWVADGGQGPLNHFMFLSEDQTPGSASTRSQESSPLDQICARWRHYDSIPRPALHISTESRQRVLDSLAAEGLTRLPGAAPTTFFQCLWAEFLRDSYASHEHLHITVRNHTRTHPISYGQLYSRLGGEHRWNQYTLCTAHVDRWDDTIARAATAVVLSTSLRIHQPEQGVVDFLHSRSDHRIHLLLWGVGQEGEQLYVGLHSAATGSPAPSADHVDTVSTDLNTAPTDGNDDDTAPMQDTESDSAQSPGDEALGTVHEWEDADRAYVLGDHWNNEPGWERMWRWPSGPVPIYDNLLTLFLRGAPSNVFLHTAGQELPLTEPHHYTLAYQREHGLPSARYNRGLLSLDDSIWVSPLVTWHFIVRLAARSKTAFQTWGNRCIQQVIDPGLLQLEGEHLLPFEGLQTANRWFLPFSLRRHQWALFEINWATRSIISHCAKGKPRLEIFKALRAELKRQGHANWTEHPSTVKRQHSEHESTIFLLMDLLCLLHGQQPRLHQSGARHARKYLLHLLWGDSGQPVPGENGVILPALHARRDIRSRSGLVVTMTDMHLPPTAIVSPWDIRERNQAKAAKRESLLSKLRHGRKRRTFRRSKPCPTISKHLLPVRQRLVQSTIRRRNRVPSATPAPVVRGTRPSSNATRARLDPVRISGWSIRAADLNLGGAFLQWNIGGTGWYGSQDAISEILCERPSVVVMQEARIPRPRIPSARRQWQRRATEYDMHAGSKLVRYWTSAGGKKQTHWVGLVLLIHKSLLPDDTCTPLEQCGLSKQAATECEGRLLLQGYGPPSGRGYVLGVYQHAGTQTRRQHSVLSYITTIHNWVKTKATTFLISGDFNAAFAGERYGGTDSAGHASDRQFQRWVSAHELDTSISRPLWTWQKPCRTEASNIDHTFAWDVRGSRPLVLSSVLSTHSGHDHRILSATTDAEFIPPLQPLPRRPAQWRLDRAKWKQRQLEWEEELEGWIATLPEGGDINAKWAQARVRAVEIAYKHAGKWQPSRVGDSLSSTNKTIYRIHWAIRQLQTALTEIERGKEGLAVQRADQLCVLPLDEVAMNHTSWKARPPGEVDRWDPMWQARHEEIANAKGASTATADHIRDCKAMFETALNKIKRIISKEVTQLFKEAAEDRLTQGGRREFKRFRDKLPARPTFTQVLPTEVRRRLLNTVVTDSQGLQAFLRFLGCAALCPADNDSHRLQLVNKDKIVTVQSSQADTWSLEVVPATMITAFLLQLPPQDEQTTPPFPLQLTHKRETPFTHVEDIISQTGVFFAWEMTAESKLCHKCNQQTTIPITSSMGDKRTLHWWCTTCATLVQLHFPSEVIDPVFAELLRANGFSRRRILTVRYSDRDHFYLLKRLPPNSGAGPDEVPYEFLQSQGRGWQRLLTAVMRGYLRGNEIPREAKGGIVTLLLKRDPEIRPENWRPIELRSTTYKLVTALSDTRLRRESDEKGVIEASQFGFRRGYCAQLAIALLQATIDDARRRKGKIYICYIDWKAAFNSVNLPKLYYMLECMGMHLDDVNLLRRAHHGSWVRVRTPWGDTAEIEVTRGSPQGDALSPSLFNLFINLLLRLLNSSGLGYACITGRKRPNTAFADDLSLTTSSPEAMAGMLSIVSQFTGWSGMSLCLHKCAITSYDYATQTELPTHMIRYEGQCIPHQAASEASKYLGIRITADGNTSAEREYVMQAANELAQQLSRHPYSYRQAQRFVSVVAHPIFLYGASMATWGYLDLRKLNQQWGLMSKRGWQLTTGHNKAPFVLPGCAGGVQAKSPLRLAAKQSVNFIQTMLRHPETALREQILWEWGQLQQEWVTVNTYDIQLALQLDMAQVRTPLTRALSYTGMLTIVPHWTLISNSCPPRPAIEAGDKSTLSLISLLRPYIVHLLYSIRVLQGGEDVGRNLASGLRRLLANGCTSRAHLLRSQGQWWIDPSFPQGERLALLDALEFSEPGTTRFDVHQALQVGRQTKRTDLNTESTDEESDLHSISSGRKRVTVAGPRRRTRRRVQQTVADETSQETSTQRKLRGLARLVECIEGLPSSQVVRARVRRRHEINDWRQASTSHLVRRLCDDNALPLFATHTSLDPPPTWPAPVAKRGWWLNCSLLTLCQRQDDHEGVLTVLPVGFPAAEPMILDQHELRTILLHGEKEPVTATMDLPRRWFDGHHTLQAFIHLLEPAPKASPQVHHQSRKSRWAQTALRAPPSIPPPAVPVYSLDGSGPRRRVGRTVQCVTHLRDRTVEIMDIVDGKLHISLDSVGARLHGDTTWSWRVERAKWEQWAHRFPASPRERAEWATTEAMLLVEREAAGYRTLCWPLLTSIARALSLTCVVGMQVLEAPPQLQWASHACEWDVHHTPLIVWDGISDAIRERVWGQIDHDNPWGVVADDSRLTVADRRMLSAHRSVAIGSEDGKRDYARGWWRTGSKKCHKGRPLTLYFSTGFDGDISFPDPGIVAHSPFLWDLESDCDPSLRTYVLNTPSGPYQGQPGIHIYTDGSLQGHGVSARMGAGWVGFTPHPWGGGFRVGGEPNIGRAERAMVAWIGKRIDTTVQAWIYLDSEESVLAMDRRSRGVFSSYLDEEPEEDVMADIEEGLAPRQMVTTNLVWIRGHAGDPGNEMADAQAVRAVNSEEVIYDRDDQQVHLHDATSGEIIGHRGWSKRVESYAARQEGDIERAWLDLNSTALSTESLLRLDAARQLRSEVMQDVTLPARALRDFFQVLSNCFPTADVVARNHYGCTSTLCPVCKADHDSLTHALTECPATADAQSAMHDSISSSIATQLRQLLPGWTVLEKTAVGTVWPTTAASDPALATFVPDVLATHAASSRIRILEVVRSVAETTAALDRNEATKRNTYHTLWAHLTSTHPSFSVLLCPLVISANGTVAEQKWRETLTSMGLNTRAGSEVIKAAIRGNIIGSHNLWNVRRSLLHDADATGLYTTLAPSEGALPVNQPLSSVHPRPPGLAGPSLIDPRPLAKRGPGHSHMHCAKRRLRSQSKK